MLEIIKVLFATETSTVATVIILAVALWGIAKIIRAIRGKE